MQHGIIKIPEARTVIQYARITSNFFHTFISLPYSIWVSPLLCIWWTFLSRFERYFIFFLRRFYVYEIYLFTYILYTMLHLCTSIFY